MGDLEIIIGSHIFGEPHSVEKSGDIMSEEIPIDYWIDQVWNHLMRERDKEIARILKTIKPFYSDEVLIKIEEAIKERIKLHIA